MTMKGQSAFSKLQHYWSLINRVFIVISGHSLGGGIKQLIVPVGRVFPNGPGDLGSIPGHIIRKTLKMVLDTSLLNTQQYKVRIKGKVEQSWERSSALSYTLVYQLLKREPSDHHRLKSPTLLFFTITQRQGPITAEMQLVYSYF